MVETINISLSGPAHSYLMMETIKSEFGQEGFLLGYICDQETQSITDEVQNHIQISRIIRVNAALPCPSLGYFYNGTGKIDENKLKSFLGSQASKVVGWYRFSKISIKKLTIRERTIHTELAKFFNIPLDLFSMCVLSRSSVYDEQKKKLLYYEYQQFFLRVLNNRLEYFSVHIVNLEDKTKAYEKNQFTSPSFQALLNNIRNSPRNINGFVFATKLHESVQEHLEHIVRDLSKEEEKLFTLQQEVNKLLADKRRNGNQLEADEYDFYEELNNDSSPCEIFPFESRKEILTQSMTPRKLQF